jgi:DNA-binding NtrC family response regulator
MARILVVDDEESIRFSFHRFLVKEKHSVATAGSYVVALAMMDEASFDLIIADINLGDGYGTDILQEVLARELMTQVIIITAYPCIETIEMSFCMNADDYIIKPVRQEDLVNSVNKSLRKTI